MKIQNALVSNIFDRSQRYFAHVTTVTLSWRVQNIVVIGRVYFTLECFEFSSTFEFDRNMLSGTGARKRWLNIIAFMDWCRSSEWIPNWVVSHNYILQDTVLFWHSTRFHHNRQICCVAQWYFAKTKFPYVIHKWVLLHKISYRVTLLNLPLVWVFVYPTSQVIGHSIQIQT